VVLLLSATHDDGNLLKR